MNLKPMEEKLSEKWNLKTAKDIKTTIFKNYSEGDKLTDILDTEKLVVCSYALGRILASPEIRLKATQLRRFYESLLNIKPLVNLMRTKTNIIQEQSIAVIHQIWMLKPQLANASARQREVIPFFEVINPLLDIVKDIDDYDRLCQFVEAIVAYHKYCGGRDQ